MNTTAPCLFSSLPAALQSRFVQFLRQELGGSHNTAVAPADEWLQAALVVDPTIQVHPARGTFWIRRGRQALENIARHYLVVPRPVAELLDRHQLLRANPADYGLTDEEWLALAL
ncbi:hypothetical protein [Hymenobacter cellulosilyticus]|uniref:Uncharacterized protein n=1 Tax=Hymenobacter cellulosilyticus TaxID=2932248 RepID=A0A8T9QG35_9BACT|nr:hypothetical protein [Hymenobacter cellulosilyticus]UOQ74790.1 hypothetical protein MUN79_13520 [Hymenobacter cellulosilyticus]